MSEAEGEQKSSIAAVVLSLLFAGIGFAYLEIISGETYFVPASINDVKGNVQSSHHILTNDLRFCYLGENDMEALFQMPELVKRKHGLKIMLVEQ